MENIIYDKDYAEARAKRIAEREKKTPVDIISFAQKSGFFAEYSRKLQEIPKIIVEQDKIHYEYLLARLDKMADRWGGHIHGEISYEKWESTIDVYLPFFEIATEDERGLLRDISNMTNLFSVQADDKGGVYIHIMINYFEDIIDEDDKDDILGDTILENPLLTALLMRQMAIDGVPNEENAIEQEVMNFLSFQEKRDGTPPAETARVLSEKIKLIPEGMMEQIDEIRGILENIAEQGAKE